MRGLQSYHYGSNPLLIGIDCLIHQERLNDAMTITGDLNCDIVCK